VIKFNYDKLIIIKYLSGGGGRFLCACLGLSDDAVFKQKDLAQMQLDGKLPIEKKLKYLLLSTKQQSERQIWDDWGLYAFWGPKEDALTRDADYLAENTINIIEGMDPIVHKCITNNKFIFCTLHGNKNLIAILNYWKNSKVIIFKNEQKFASKRILGKKNIIPHYNFEIDLRLKVELAAMKLDSNKLLYEWDCDWYYSRDRTVSEIQKLYDSFGLSGFNSEVISKFYEAWINAIKL